MSLPVRFRLLSLRSRGPVACVVLCALWIGFAVPPRAQAQEVVMDAGRLAHALDRLSGTARVLYVAAHPDDENTRLLTYLANGRHVTATYLSMTRGGGGQNLIGREQDSLLDVLRTQELLSARRLDSAAQRFTRMRDFGYSKSAQETLASWGHDEALADVVWTIRTFQPDVIITRFDEQPPNHGHHTASAVLAREAFAAAADPTRFADQLKLGARPWQATRLVHNLPHWNKNPAPGDALILDVGAYDARLGLSYGELAARSRSQHKSQGFGAASERGEILERFIHVAGKRAERDVLDGVTLGWDRFGGAAAPLVAALSDARKHLHRDHPERAVPAMLAAYRALSKLPADDPRVRDAREHMARWIAAASGLFARASAERATCTPGGALPVKLVLMVRRPIEVSLRRVALPDGTTSAQQEALSADHERELSLSLRCPAGAEVSTPYWLAKPPLPGRHEVSDPRLLVDPEGAAPLALQLELSVAGELLPLTVPVVQVWTDRVQGERERRVLIAPPATVTPARDALMFPNGKSARLALRVRAAAEGVRGRVLLELPAGFSAEPAAHEVSLAHVGDETVVSFELKAPRVAAAQAGGAEAAAPIYARPVVEVDGARYSFREDAIDYAHVPLQSVLQPARVRLSPLSLRTPKGLVGYVEGSGDTIAADLAHVGVSVETLDDHALLEGKLARYAAIVLGARAYNTRDALKPAHARLMEYVEQGGTLVVQYVTRSSFSPLDQPVGPYPLEIGRGRVTDEHAAVKLLSPVHAVLLAPNRIAQADFEGWIQERGLYFGEKWDSHYQPVLEIADPGEAAQQGALLVARHGKGRYVYTGLSFFRQLPAGVAGAYRLFVNLLAPNSGAAR